jgi:hypothetical protein
VITRTLCQRIVTRTSERPIFEAIRFLQCDPEIVPPPAAISVLTVEPYRGRYRICEEGKNDMEVLGLSSVVEHLSSRVAALSFQAKPHAGVLHAALLQRGGRRVLITGRQAAGKTTLALRLVQAGYELEGDEHVFLESDGITARPRACRVKETSLPYLPGIANLIEKAPVYVDYFGQKIFNVDPRLIAGSWRIEKTRAECVIVLQPNHGGYSSLRRMQPLALSQALISEFGLRDTGRGAAIGAVVGLVSKSKGYDLSLGDHETAIKCIDRALED